MCLLDNYHTYITELLCMVELRIVLRVPEMLAVHKFVRIPLFPCSESQQAVGNPIKSLLLLLLLLDKAAEMLSELQQHRNCSIGRMEFLVPNSSAAERARK
jgi:hypothetical protein